MSTQSKIELPDWIKPLFDKEHRYYVFHGGRGSAKSHSIAGALILMAAREPLRILCGREIQNSIKDSVKRLLDDKIDLYGLQDFYESTDKEIRGKNGSLFIFSGFRSNISSLKSKEGIDICWGEEAQDNSESTFRTLIPTIREKGSFFIFSYNPRFETDPINVRFRGEHTPPRSYIKEVNYDMNPWFPDELREEMEFDKLRDFDNYLHVWEGQYAKNSEARVFKNWRVEDFKTPEDAEFKQGCDFGFSIDPTTLIRMFIVGRKLFIDYEAYMVGCEIVNTGALFMTIPDAEKWPIIADSARPETISHLRKEGFKIMGAAKGKDSVKEGIEFIKSYDVVIHPRCKKVINEFTMYSYKVDKDTEQVLPIVVDKHNHTIDAIRYALEGARRTQKNTRIATAKPVRTVRKWK